MPRTFSHDISSLATATCVPTHHGQAFAANLDPQSVSRQLRNELLTLQPRRTMWCVEYLNGQPMIGGRVSSRSEFSAMLYFLPLLRVPVSFSLCFFSVFSTKLCRLCHGAVVHVSFPAPARFGRSGMMENVLCPGKVYFGTFLAALSANGLALTGAKGLVIGNKQSDSAIGNKQSEVIRIDEKMPMDAFRARWCVQLHDRV